MCEPATPNAEADAQVLVVMAGLTPEDEGEEHTTCGDRTSFKLNPKRDSDTQRAIIDGAIATGHPVIVVIEAGSVIARREASHPGTTSGERHYASFDRQHTRRRALSHLRGSDVRARVILAGWHGVGGPRETGAVDRPGGALVAALARSSRFRAPVRRAVELLVERRVSRWKVGAQGLRAAVWLT